MNKKEYAGLKFWFNPKTTTYLLSALFVLVFIGSAFALTTNTTTPTGGVFNGGFEYGTGTLTTNGWMGDINSNIYFVEKAVDSNASFDTSIFHSGLQSIRIDMGVGGRFFLTTGLSGDAGTVTPVLNNVKTAPRVKPSTKYKASAWEKTQDINTNVSMALKFYDITGTYVAPVTNLSPSTLTGNNDWTYLTATFTSPSNAYYAVLYGQRPTAGNAGQVWFDDVRLEEVGTVPLTGQVSGRPSITVTGVSDFNAIDQADTNNTSTVTFGDATKYITGQCFTPTQSAFNGITFQRAGNGGTYTGDVIVSLRDENTLRVNTPLNTILTSTTIPNATWNAITVTTDHTTYLPYTLVVNGTRRYCIDFNSTTQDAVNYPALRQDSTAGTNYTGGARTTYDGSVWSTTTADLYFKTLFEKQSSAFDLNVCSSGDTVCDSKTYDLNFLADGATYTINPQDAPLFYQGDNNVYLMGHSDSLFQNKTPSLMAKLSYTFDHPTTILTTSQSGSTNTRTITLTCTNGTTGTCFSTLYSLDGINWTTYTQPIELTNGNYTIRYYSTDTSENYESTQTTNLTIAIQANQPTCQLLWVLPLILATLIIVAILSALAIARNGLDSNTIILLVGLGISGVIGIVILASVLSGVCIP